MISDANKRLKVNEVKDVALGSMDAVALYPSIGQILSAKIVAKLIWRVSLSTQVWTSTWQVCTSPLYGVRKDSKDKEYTILC